MTNKDKTDAREWFINPVVGYRCEVNEGGIGLSGNEVHVIEYSAYQALAARVQKLEAALESISKNSCCDTCQEAKLVALKALGGE